MSETITSLIINYLPFILLVIIGWYFGRRHERQHWHDLAITEKSLGHIIISSERFYEPQLVAGSQGELVLGSVVVAQDYFKMIIANIMNLIGKNLFTYETLLERARREAIVRMKLEANYLGCNQIYGVRLEVTNINQLGTMVEAIAYGTAVHSVGNPKVPPALPPQV